MMSAVGVVTDIDNRTPITKMLSLFSVGTENEKRIRLGAPDPNLISPITNLPNNQLVFNEAAVMKRMGQLKNKHCKKDEKKNNNKENEKPSQEEMFIFKKD